MKPFDVGTSTCINFDVENNDKNPQFSIHDHVGISKYKIFFAKVNIRKTFLLLKKVKNDEHI